MPTRKGTTKSAGRKRSTKGSEKRTEISPKGDDRYIKRDPKGRIKESDDKSKSLSKDVRQHAKKEVKPGYGDQGDQPRSKAGRSKKSRAKK